MPVDRTIAAFCLPLLLLACAEGSEPDPTPAQDGGDPYSRIDPVPAPLPGAQDAASAGAWRETSVEGRRGLVFAPPGDEPIFAMFCRTPEGLVLERRGLVPSGEIDMMRLSAGSTRQALAVTPMAQGDPALRAVMPFNDPLFTQLRESPVDITVTVGEDRPITLPASPLVPELVAQCRIAEGDRTTGL